MGDDEKLQSVFALNAKQEVDVKTGEVKNFEDAILNKDDGNDFYRKKDFKLALASYNLGIVKCPQNTAEEQELLSKLLANRSSVFFELKEYEKVIKDIVAVEKLRCYPTELIYKLEWRKARSLEMLMNFKKADQNYDETLKFLVEYGIITEALREENIQMIEASKKESEMKQTELNIFEDVETFRGGEQYIAAHPAIDIAYNKKSGRYAVANKDIPIGTLILKEEAHVAVLTKNKSLMNCQHCFQPTDQPLPCPNCANIIFCSPACQKIALDSYHVLECQMFDTIRDSGPNIFLLVRMFTQKGFHFFFDQRDKLSEYLADKRPLGLPQKDIYRHDDFDNVMFLYRKDHNTTEFDAFAFYTTGYVLQLLRLMNFFPFKAEGNILSEEELFIAKLFLRNCRMVFYNVHGMGEITPLENKLPIRYGLESAYELVRLGVGLFPTLSFFNHSCDPSVVRINKNRHILVRTIKPIRTGEVIYDNYGPHYIFECKCTACEENWPNVENMIAEFKVPCRNRRCNYIMTVTSEHPDPKRCSSCHRTLHSGTINYVRQVSPQ
nr:SET and MYND domain-containing protein 4-like [Leptinotarsa decemlineata]